MGMGFEARVAHPVQTKSEYAYCVPGIGCMVVETSNWTFRRRFTETKIASTLPPLPPGKILSNFWRKNKQTLFITFWNNIGSEANDTWMHVKSKSTEATANLFGSDQQIVRRKQSHLHWSRALIPYIAGNTAAKGVTVKPMMITKGQNIKFKLSSLDKRLTVSHIAVGKWCHHNIQLCHLCISLGRCNL